MNEENDENDIDWPEIENELRELQREVLEIQKAESDSISVAEWNALEVRTITLEEVRAVPGYAGLSELAEIFSHEIIEDDHGTWRWKANRLSNYVLAGAAFYTGGYAVNSSRGKLDLNTLWEDFYNEKFTLQELVKFYMGINYSLGGFMEVFGQRSVQELPKFCVPENYEVDYKNREDFDTENEYYDFLEQQDTWIDFLLNIHHQQVLKSL